MANVIKELISEKDVDEKIRILGEQISKDYEGRCVHLVCVLKGSVFFMCELAKRITVPVTMDFMSVSSYGDGTVTSGIVKIIKDLDETIEGKDVIVVEDIIDTGHTAQFLMNFINHNFKPRTLKFCSLLDKKCKREVEIEADYYCFEIDNKFLVGYGLDYDGYYRNLPYIGFVEGV